MTTQMTLGNMRANGVCTLVVWCHGRGCNHEAILDVSSYVDDVPVPAFGPRLVCTVCGAIGADARPNWNEGEQGQKTMSKHKTNVFVVVARAHGNTTNVTSDG